MAENSCSSPPFLLTPIGPSMLRTTILRHEPDPGGPQPHFDWLLEAASTASPEDRVVPTYRCRRRPDRLAIGESIRLQKIDAHRGWWLARSILEEVTLGPPMGTARVIQSGRIDSEPPLLLTSMESTVCWSQSRRVMTYRLEQIRPGEVLATRIAPFSMDHESSPSPVTGVSLL
jgi:hypothetical protein